MIYPDELIEEVRSRSDIVDVIGRYVKIQKRGSNYIGLCPFHSEKTPSFSVSQTKQMYKCFGCGEGGNVITFMMKYERMSFPEAVKSLADSAGVSLPEPEYSEEARKKENVKNILLEINKEAAKYFYYQLRAPQGAKGYDYFVNRKLSEDTMKKFGLGYANITSDDLTKYLRSKGYQDEHIIASGLSDFSEKYGIHDKFWNRVMFPITDINHRVIGFGGRVLGDGEPKYLNSPETLIFDKGRNLFAMNIAKSSNHRPYFILCEGYMDVISMHQAGFDCAVASLGTAFTEQQANLLNRYRKDIILSYDSDNAGVKAALRAIAILKHAGADCRVLNLEPYKDPDEFIKNLGQEAFEERIKNAENSFFYTIRMLSRNYDMNDPAGKTAFDRELAKRICDFPDAIERDNYLKAMALEYGINEASLKSMVLKIAAQTGGVEPAYRPKTGITSKKNPEDKYKKPQRLFLTWLVDYPKAYFKVKKYVSVMDFSEGIYRQVAEKLFADLEKGIVNPAAIISLFADEEEQKEVATLFSTEVDNLETTREKEKAFKEILYALKKSSYELHKDEMDYNEVFEGRKNLEEIAKIHISLED